MGGGRGAPIYQGYRTLYKTYVVPFDKDLYLLARTIKKIFSWGGGARIRGAHQKWGGGGGGGSSPWRSPFLCHCVGENFRQ